MESSIEVLQRSPEETGEGRWMSYDEISYARGIGRESAVKLVKREKWRRVMGNDGTARALVPLDRLKLARKSSGGHSAEDGQELSRILAEFEAALAAMREQAEAERQRANRAEQASAVEAFKAAIAAMREQTEVERHRANRAEQARAVEAFKAALAAMREQAEAERHRADRAEQARHGLQAELIAEKEARARAEGDSEAQSARADKAEAALAIERETRLWAEDLLRQAEDGRVAFWSRGLFTRLLVAWMGSRD
jgi:predicted  nucleic acid-binding Zn-ribbon protein